MNLNREYLESLSLLSVRGLWKSQKACLRDNSLSSETTVKGQQYLRGGKFFSQSQWILFSRNASCGGTRTILYPSAFETGAGKGQSVRCITMLAETGTPSVTMQGGQRPLGLKGISQAWVEGALCRDFNVLYNSSRGG